jgi:hypothetical protein
MEDLFSVPHLGFAAQTGLKAFGSDVYNAHPCAESSTRPKASRGRFHRGAVIRSAVIHGRTLYVRMEHRARLGGLIKGREVLGPRQAYPCRTYRFRLSSRHGRLVLRARRDHALEQRALRF